MLIKFYKEMFCKKEEKKEEKCPYMEYIEEQEKVLKRKHISCYKLLTYDLGHKELNKNPKPLNSYTLE